MSRSLPTTWPIRRGDDTHSDATAGCGEETCTTVAIRLRPLNGREKEGKQKKIWRCAPAHDTITQVNGSVDSRVLLPDKGSAGSEALVFFL